MAPHRIVAQMSEWVTRAGRFLTRFSAWRGRRLTRHRATARSITAKTTPVRAVIETLELERARWFLWVPVAFGTGIGIYFSLTHEPRGWLLIGLLALTIAARIVWRRGTFAPVATGLAFWMIAGLVAASARTHLIAAPVLREPITARMAAGFVEAIEPRLPGGARITMRLRAVQGLADAARPERVRFVWAGRHDLRVGDGVSVRLSLQPPPIPVRPGGYDFARRAWFQQIGAVGFAVAPPVRTTRLPVRPALLDETGWIGGLRADIAARIEQHVPGETGAVINALIVGKRGKVPEATLEHLRRSGLSHMLAISGLHMAMIAGALFWLLRGALAAVPAFALNLRIKKTAALCALLGGIAYLAISGASVATQRAAIMIGLMLVAILLDRPAISLRNVALAALIILLIAPENLLEIGFQMSFAAVVGLVAFYEWWTARREVRADQDVRAPPLLPAWLQMPMRAGQGLIVGTLVSTFVAGLAVAPFGAFHFHRVAQLSLIANLLAMPVFTVVVMPMALVTLLTLPFGLEGYALGIMAWGIEQVVAVAAMVSAHPSSVRATSLMAPAAFVAMVFGGLWLCLWRRAWRFAGLIPIALGFAAAGLQTAPDVLVGRNGTLVAVRNADGSLDVSPGRGGTFEIERWLEADGSLEIPEAKHRGRSFTCDETGCAVRVRGRLLAMPRTPANVAEDCRRADIIVMAFDQALPCPSAQIVIDRAAIATRGVHTLFISTDGMIAQETVAAARGVRPWSR
ncbi:MAG: ComEC/Rec2 family competence protein [Pseudomonadota bacterium]